MTKVPVSDFEARYRSDPDPWRFADCEYEQRRYEITMATMPHRRYRRAFEPGCATGELTHRLAERCDSVVAWDGSPTVVEHARRRCAALANAELDVGVVPDDWPTGHFDLVVLSEIGYYFDRCELARLATLAGETLEPGGTLLGVHWLGESADHVLHGDEVHDVLFALEGVTHGGAYRDAGFRLDWWDRT
ncbi:MAG: nodulation S family protein [Actinomycetota bacterium]|jgi:SAM-dependent methyltransferase|nr:nodulation S family protein [Actinomycetota bacterium]